MTEERKERGTAFFSKFGPYIIGLAICIVVPPFLPMYVQSVLSKVAVFAIFAMSLDLLMGYTGLLSLGHAAFFGVGGYMAAIIMKNFEITNFWIFVNSLKDTANLLVIYEQDTKNKSDLPSI